jgi:hypothetical protein
VEALIRLAAPALDLTLYLGDKLSKIAGRNELSPRVTSSGGRACEPGGRNRSLRLEPPLK